MSIESKKFKDIDKLYLHQGHRNNLLIVGLSHSQLLMPNREFSDILPSPCAVKKSLYNKNSKY